MIASPARRMLLALAALLLAALLLAPCASASTGSVTAPLALFGLPSLHSVIKAIATGFFGALASALVPSFLTHGTVATIQYLVALPDPASWAHVSRLQGDTTYLAAMLLPVTLAVSATRYWLIGLTGTAHPASAVVRCASATGVLVAYSWIVEQVVAATNTLTHGILGLPAVSAGLQRIIGVLFGGALLSGAGGVFGAFLVIIGVLFAAGLFAAQVMLTVLLAVLIVAGPPLIVLSAIPELAHLARAWSHALLAVALVPLGWTVLFATAGALSLDASSFTGASGGLSAHVEAAFAGLITFALAVKLPLIALGEIRHLFSSASLRPGGPGPAQASSAGSERVRSAHARLRAVGLEGIPSLGASAGRAAGALGAPPGGAVGAARRGLAGAARRSGIATPQTPGAPAGAPPSRTGAKTGRGGVRERLQGARAVLASAPSDARGAINRSIRRADRVPPHVPPTPTTPRAASSSGARGAPPAPPPRTANAEPAKRSNSTAPSAQRVPGAAGVNSAHKTPRAQPSPRQGATVAVRPPQQAGPPASPAPEAHPGRKVSASARRENAAPAPSPSSKRSTSEQPRTGAPRPLKPVRPAAGPPSPPRAGAPRERPPRARKAPGPRSGK